MSSVKGLSLVNNALFPAPDPPSYHEGSFPGELIWVTGEGSDSPVPCLFMRPHDPPTATHLVIYCHGNGCDLGQMYPELQAYAHRWNCFVLAPEYPGYGPCDGLPSEATLKQNLRTAYRWVTEQLGWGPDRVILFGRSIGTGPCTWLAAEEARRGVHVAALVIQSPYLSIKTLAKSLVGFWAKFMLDRFKNYKEIRHVLCPVIAIHGKADNLIPFQHTVRLMETCPSEDKKVILPPAADHNMFHLFNDVISPCLEFFEETLEHFHDPEYSLSVSRDKIERATRQPSNYHRSCIAAPGFFSSVARSTARGSSTLFEVTAGAFSMITDKTKPVDHTTDPQ